MKRKITWLEDRKFYDFLVTDERVRFELQVKLPTKERHEDEEESFEMVLTDGVEIKLNRFNLSLSPDQSRVLVEMLQTANAEIAAWVNAQAASEFGTKPIF